MPAPDRPSRPRGRSRKAFANGGALQLGANVVCMVLSTVTSLTLLFGAWVLIGWAAAGWSPIVVASDSMQPTLDRGDVMLVADDSAIAPHDVIVVERGEDLIARRVVSVEDGFLVADSDADASIDADRVLDEEVVGSARLVIPIAGLPIVWAQSGDWIPFGAWAALTGAGVICTTVALTRALRRRRDPDASAVSVARVGIQRVRVLSAVLIIGQLVIARDGGVDFRDAETQLSLVAVVLLLFTNSLPAIQARRGRLSERSVALMELAIDTTLVLVLTASTDTGLTWILFALPIIEAAVRFRLVGALVHWMVLTAVTITLEVWDSADQSVSGIVDALESQLDQLGVLFLFVVPAAYLAEQLIGEVSTWQRATGRARRRSELLARVADVGQEVTRLEGSHVETILAGVRSVGFARADMATDQSDGRWRLASHDNLPAPGGPASGTREIDLGRRASIVTLLDPDETEAAALADARLSSVITHLISEQGGHRIVLRAATLAGDPITTERIEAFRLVAGQASVALQNDRLMAEVTSMHDELEHQASHDGLTGLPNRTMMLRRLREAQRLGRTPTVLFLDLDGFKPVNDRLGHDIGDVLLQRVAERLDAAVPERALVARLGGDEFTILLTDCDPPAVDALAERIVDSISTPFEIGDQVVHISTSVGIASGSRGMDDAEIIRRADVSMYQAKHSQDGRSIEVYRAEFDDDADRRAQLLDDIGRALEERTLHLVFQPIVDTRRGDRIVGAEALVRWDHPVFGRISPTETIEVARASNKSDHLNRYIVRTGIDWIAHAHQASGDHGLFVAINASPEELDSANLADRIGAEATRAGVAPEAIAIEISERIVTPVSVAAERNMEELQALGVRLLLDDFGEGTTSLTYLQELPIDGVKLDRRLVVNALRSRTDRLVLESIVDLSQRIGHSVIAEGIESEAHLGAVRDAGCSLVQGFHLHMPMLGEELTALIVARQPGPAGAQPLPSVGLFGDDESWTRPLVEPTAAPLESVLPAPDPAHAFPAPSVPVPAAREAMR